jgi:hypothetical protein
MIFGGLEIVAGGYFAHKYYKNKNEKRRLEDEAQHRRNNTFPSNRPASNRRPSYPLQPHFQHQEQRPQQPQQPQKYACHAPTPPRTASGLGSQPRPQHQTRPKPSHTQSFTIPRRPVPQRKPEILIQPSLQRADSMATLSRMPIANGYRPSDQAGLNPPHAASNLDPVQQSPYGNVGFAVSSPALGGMNMSPVGYSTGAVHSVDDNWETYGHQAHRYSAYAPTEASTQLGERDPPPPYVP